MHGNTDCFGPDGQGLEHVPAHVAVEFSCGASTGENGTSFVSPPSPIRICNLMVSRLNDDICQVKVQKYPKTQLCANAVRVSQIRLELDTFDLAAPNAEGDCQSDFFLVTGVGTQVPQLCGLNSGQHGKETGPTRTRGDS